MENPADIFTTGIHMSGKGNFDHIQYGCGDGSTTIDVSVVKLEDHVYPNNSLVVLQDSTCDNDQYINNSIQDGFQSEILCSFVCDAGLQSNLPMSDVSSVAIESISGSNSHIDFSNSPGTSFAERIEPFSPMEGLVSSFDEQLDSYLLSGFKDENRIPSEDGDPSETEEQRNVTEAICDIAKSFGLEDLLPETFQVDGKKDSLCVTVTTNELCGGNENIEELPLSHFDRCSGLNSPTTDLNLADDDYVLNGLEMISQETKPYDSCISSKVLHLSKDDENSIFINSNSNLLTNNDIINLVVKDNLHKSENSVECKEGLENEKRIEKDENACMVEDDLVKDIPTVSISDAQFKNPVDQNGPPAGTVLITTDKASKKMQIVLTLNQGQQIYDIDTECMDASQPIDLDFPTSFTNGTVQQEPSHLSDDEATDMEQFHILNNNGEEQTYEVIEEASPEKSLTDFVSNMPSEKVRKIKTWVCPIEDCGQVLDRECKLRVHLISHKGARPFKCTFDGCDWAFTTPYRLRRHVETHIGNKDFTCDFEGCNRKFTTVYNLKTHKKRHKWPNSLTCPSKDCKMSFANRRKLELHLRIHKDIEAPYKCTKCGKQYYSANCIASHYRTHQYNEDDFKCPFERCGKVYDKICRLKQHIRHHTNERPYTCPAEGCKWSFMSASKLTRHMRKHTGERKFVCSEPGCGKSFMRPEHLKGHVVIHSGDRPFHCPHENCNARFTAKSSLYVHVKKHCPSVLKVVYPCPVESCVKKYNNKATLKQHVQKLHPEIVQDGKQLNISEKLELTMPVSVVNQPNDMSLDFMDFDEIVADDPSFLRLQLFSNDQSSGVSSLCLNSGPETSFSAADATCKTVPKTSRTSHSVQSTKTSRAKKSAKPSKLFNINRYGCARADYCFKYNPSKPPEAQASFIYLNHSNEDTTDSKSFLLNNQLPTDIKSPDLMLASSSIYHENPSEQLIKNDFSSDNSSTGHSLYADDSLLVGNGAFTSELIPVSLLSDDVDSDESVLNPDTSGIDFSEQNDTFSESIHLHGLD